ncbi:MAG: DMT family transporter [Acidobacteriia bacterium]|nr:DMT family transporter [Terriglobia bacterium]
MTKDSISGVITSSPPRAVTACVLCLGVVAISFGSIFVRLCEAPSLVIAAYRLLIATIVLVPFQISRQRDRKGGQSQGKAVYYLLAGIFLALHFATWIASLKYTSVASSVVLVTANPIFVALFSWWFLREGISRRAIIGILVAVAGGILIARADVGIGQDTLKGDALALLGAVMMAGYLLTGRVIRSVTPLTQYVFRVYAVAAGVLVLFCTLREPNWVHYSGRTFLFFCLLALVPQSIGHTSLNWALRYFPAAIVAVCTLLEPVGASLLALLIFKEVLTPEKVLGGFIILAGIYLSISDGRSMKSSV